MLCVLIPVSKRYAGGKQAVRIALLTNCSSNQSKTGAEISRDICSVIVCLCPCLHLERLRLYFYRHREIVGRHKTYKSAESYTVQVKTVRRRVLKRRASPHSYYSGISVIQCADFFLLRFTGMSRRPGTYINRQYNCIESTRL